jgi:HAD superfamily hydrolase (TIGR01509 family)
MTVSITWNQIDTVMFDMDGTLLDLAFDNFFWREAVINAWAESQQISREQALNNLTPLFKQQEGCLNWYSLPYWSELLNLDLQALKAHHSDRISLREGVPSLLKTLQNHNKELWLVTNAHPQALNIKLQKTGLADYFKTIISSHQHGFAKEQIGFWESMQKSNTFIPARTLLIDDSEPVLHTAQACGLHVLGIEQPDSKLPARLDLYHPPIREWSELTNGLET